MASNQRCDSHGWARYLALQLSVSATYTVQQYPFSLSLCSVRNVIAFSTNSYCMQTSGMKALHDALKADAKSYRRKVNLNLRDVKEEESSNCNLLNRNLVISTQKQILIFHTDK